MSKLRLFAILALILVIILFFIFVSEIQMSLAPSAIPTNTAFVAVTSTPTAIDTLGVLFPPKTITNSLSKSPTSSRKASDTPVDTTIPGLTAEEQVYDQFMIRHHTKFNQYMDELGALFVNAGEEEFIYDDDWHLSVERYLDLMIFEAEEIAGYEDVPERFTAVHSWLEKLAPETKELSASILRAVEDEHVNILEAKALYDHMNNILTFVLNANEERGKIIPFGRVP